MSGFLHQKRLQYRPATPELLSQLDQVHFQPVPSSRKPLDALKKRFPNTWGGSSYQLKKGKGSVRPIKVGALFSGGQAPGGHNVLAGIFDAGAQLIGFLGGPSGLLENRSKEIRNIDAYRNQGGFDLLGSSRTKIEKEEDLARSLKTVEAHGLDGLVIIGGDDSNTNAALLAEYFLAHGSSTSVVGVPKTIDGDLRSEEIELSFGFDTACKTYAELIGNIARDALSAKKYYHFIKLMGRSASHIALECALATHPNLTLISEEKKSLEQIVGELAELIVRRHQAGKEYGVILIPEGLADFIPGISDSPHLQKDPHGNVNVSQIETEKLLIDLVKQELKRRHFSGKFSPLEHFFGYEGRAALPSNFDANYTYTLGLLAALAIREKQTGVLCAVQHLAQPPQHWELKMVPIVQLMHLEIRSAQEKPVIQKALVDLKSAPFLHFSRLCTSWEIEDDYQYPGPIQFFGDSLGTDSVPAILGVKP